jgi:transcription-repair coupling factor (superfamily II helicase)
VLDELTDRYGEIPPELLTLTEVSRLRRRALALGLTKVLAAGSTLRVEPVTLADSRMMRMQRMYPGAKLIQASETMVFPLPLIDGQPPRDRHAVEWVAGIFSNLLEPDVPAEAPETNSINA